MHRGYFDNCLIGTHISYNLIFLNKIALFDLPFENLAFNDTLSYVWQDKIFIHLQLPWSITSMTIKNAH